MSITLIITHFQHLIPGGIHRHKGKTEDRRALGREGCLFRLYTNLVWRDRRSKPRPHILKPMPCHWAVGTFSWRFPGNLFYSKNFFFKLPNSKFPHGKVSLAIYFRNKVKYSINKRQYKCLNCSTLTGCGCKIEQVPSTPTHVSIRD